MLYVHSKLGRRYGIVTTCLLTKSNVYRELKKKNQTHAIWQRWSLLTHVFYWSSYTVCRILAVSLLTLWVFPQGWEWVALIPYQNAAVVVQPSLRCNSFCDWLLISPTGDICTTVVTRALSFLPSYTGPHKIRNTGYRVQDTGVLYCLLNRNCKWIAIRNEINWYQ